MEPASPSSAVAVPPARGSWRAALRRHWPEYLTEAAGLGLFMISAAVFASILWHPGSPVQQAIGSEAVRRALMGVAMGCTAVAIIYSPWGKQSGAHINPALTLTFLRLRKMDPRDAVFYMAAQFAGGAAGLALAAVALRPVLAHPAVNYVVTQPGPRGPAVAFAAETGITFVLMLVVLYAMNSARLNRFTGLFAGALVASYILLETPLSGMSLNPARTLGSALPPRAWSHLWIYFTAPPLGMLLAAQLYLWRRGAHRVFCAKLHHHNDRRCIFHCRYTELERPRAVASAS